MARPAAGHLENGSISWPTATSVKYRTELHFSSTTTGIASAEWATWYRFFPHSTAGQGSKGRRRRPVRFPTDQRRRTSSLFPHQRRAGCKVERRSRRLIRNPQKNFQLVDDIRISCAQGDAVAIGPQRQMRQRIVRLVVGGESEFLRRRPTN